MGANISLLFGGLLFLLFGYAFANPVLSFAATSGGLATIGSFTGAQAVNDLGPIIYYFMVILGALGAMGLGGLGLAGKGPTAG